MLQGKIDEALLMIENADPTGETNPDPPNMVVLEGALLIGSGSGSLYSHV